MNIERVSSFDTESAGSSRDRAGGRESGFADVMDSVLGVSSENRPAGRESSDSRGEKAARGRDPRSISTAPRKSVRAEDNENEEVAEQDSVDVRSPDRGEGLSEESGDRRVHKDEPFGDDGPVVTATIPAYEVAALLAVPVLEGLGSGESGEEIDSGEIVVEELDSGAAADDVLFEGLADGLIAGGDAEAEATTHRQSVISDPTAREGFLAALESAKSKQDDAVVVAEGEVPAADATRISEEARPSLPIRALESRVAPQVEEGKRGQLESAVPRPSGIPQEGARSQADLGSDDSSRERRGETQQPSLIPVERTVGDSPAPSADLTDVTDAADVAVDGARAGVIDTPLRTEETNTQARLDSLPTPIPVRAPELSATVQTGRLLPTSPPDAIAIQADWLATRGGGTARLVLNPPELGEIAIRVTVRQQSVEIVMIAQTALAHSMAEDQGDRLSQAFAQRDLRLDQFEVRRGDPTDASGTGQFASSDAGTRERERAEHEAGAPGGAGARGGRRSAGMGRGGIAPPPRVESNATQSRVDLRI